MTCIRRTCWLFAASVCNALTALVTSPGKLSGLAVFLSSNGRDVVARAVDLRSSSHDDAITVRSACVGKELPARLK